MEKYQLSFSKTQKASVHFIPQCEGYLDAFPKFGDLRFEWLCGYHGQFGWHVALGAVWWISALWITGHVWFPHSERMAKSEKYVSVP